MINRYTEYNNIRSKYISDKMKEGIKNGTAKKMFDKSNEKIKAVQTIKPYKTKFDNDKPFFRPSGSEWDDYAYTANDF